MDFIMQDEELLKPKKVYKAYIRYPMGMKIEVNCNLVSVDKEFVCLKCIDTIYTNHRFIFNLDNGLEVVAGNYTPARLTEESWKLLK